jgi:hypothetical protein
MADKPTKYPEFASNPDTNDPVTGALNIQEPTPAKKVSGWVYPEYPPYNIFNWIHNLVYRWIAWFDQQEQDHEARITQNETDIGTNSNDIDANELDIAKLQSLFDTPIISDLLNLFNVVNTNQNIAMEFNKSAYLIAVIEYGTGNYILEMGHHTAGTFTQHVISNSVLTLTGTVGGGDGLLTVNGETTAANLRSYMVEFNNPSD